MQMRIGTFDEFAEAIRHVRRTVFVEEQGVPEGEEFDESDPVCEHAVVLQDGAVVATGRVDTTGRIGRVAVLREARGRGIGRSVMQALEQRARELGCRRAWMHAQVHAIGFYRTLGYVASGEEFMEAGIRHVTMARPLGEHDAVVA